MNEEILRDSIRRAIRVVKKKRSVTEQKENHDEIKLREYVRRLINIETKILEEGGTPDNDPAPHGNTGINVLEDLLKKIIPVLETDYKLLTTSTDQRESFRSHIINAVVGTLTPVEANNAADDGGEDSIEIQEEVDIDMLSNAEDQDLFYDYLIANLKLYFDKFEKELDNTVEEPTNQAYDTAKQSQPDSDSTGDELDFNI